MLNTKPTHQRPPRAATRRTGSMLSVELVLVLPILMLVLLAFVEFGLLLMATQGVSASANLGAREAALASSTEASVVAAADGALAGWVWQGYHEVVIFVDGVKAYDSSLMVPDTAPGDQIAAAATGAEISVTINVPMTDAAPDLLAYFGISLAGKDLTTTFVTRKE